MTVHHGARGRLALIMFASSMTITGVAAVFHATGGTLWSGDQWGVPGSEGVLALATALVGYLIARKTSNPTGWIFSTIGVGGALQYLTEQYARVALVVGWNLPGAVTVAWVTEWIWVPLMVSIGLLLLIFPDDHIGSLPGRIIAVLGGGAGLATFLAAAFFAPRLATWDVANPYAIGINQELGDAAFVGAVLTMMLMMVAGAIRLVGRLWRATGIRKQQLKWFSYAAVFASVGNVFGAIPATSAVGSKFAVFGIISIAGASAIAVLKYRLYEIDVVINRTLVYAALTAVLAAVYVGLVFGFQAIMAPFTADSDLAIAASTLGVAALFRPARSQVQDFIDRRFYRRKFDAEQTVAEFSVRLRNEVELGSVTAQLTDVVQETMEPTHVSLWMRPVVQR